ncbi:hypothetical protein [Pseudonocardia sp.]|uniref:hypothetical protein n=1 Tax=Pseudonocardia sp. TaxID=60912 RepID=UPI003D0BB26E
MSAPTLRGPVLAGLAGKAVEAVTLVLLATLVPRLLGPADYGGFAVALTVVALGSLAMTMGGATLLARYVPAAADPAGVAAALTRRLARNRAVAFAGLVLVGAVASAAGWLPPVQTALVLAALGCNVVATLALQADLGLGRALAWSFRYPLQNAVLVAGVLLLHGRFGATGAVVAILVAGAVAAVLGLAVAAPLWGATAPIPDGALRFGVLQAAGGVLAQSTQRGGVLAVAVLAGSAVETGYAGLATGIALAATYAVVQVFTVTLPVLAGRPGAGAPAAVPVPEVTNGRSTRAAEGGDAHAEDALRRIACWLLAAVVAVAVVAVPALPVAVPVVFGAAYAAAVPAFVPALAAVVLAPVNALAIQAAALRLRPDATVRAALAGFVAFVVVALYAVPGWGAVSASSGALAGAGISALASIRLLPGAVGTRLAILSFGGAAAVVLLGVLWT